MNTAIRNEVLDNKNKNNVRCQYCYSLILRQNQGDFVKQDLELPLMYQKNSKDGPTIEKETLQYFWKVNDMFTFENIGFSHTVDHCKYLTCADCDMGPVGYHDINTKQCFVALERVTHGDNPDNVIESDAEADEDER